MSAAWGIVTFFDKVRSTLQRTEGTAHEQREWLPVALSGVGDKETIVAGIGNYKLSDALSPGKAGGKKGGGAASKSKTAAEQVRADREKAEARSVEVSSRDPIVGIGRGK